MRRTRPEPSRTRPAPGIRRLLERRVWAVACVSYLAITATWVLATPLSASPDEPEHVHRAAAVVRGELLGQDDDAGRLVVTAPAGVVSPSKEALCFAFRPEITADCAEPLRGGDELVEAGSEAARYNPVYYAVVGLPSLVLPNETGIYAMRLLSAALCSALLASAVASVLLWRAPRLLLAGLAVATTPMVLFLNATVNPNALEISGALALWTSGLVLAAQPAASPVTGLLLRRCAIAAAALVVTRQLSPLWLALIALALAVCAGWPRVRALARRTDTRLWAGLVAVVTVLATAWVRLAGSLSTGPVNSPDLTLLDGVRASLGRVEANTTQLIGIFGWLDTPAPWLTYVVFTAAIATVTVVGLAAAGARTRLVVLGALAASFVLPVLIEGSQFAKLGFVWQGRYTLPIAVGVPLAAAWGASRRGLLPGALVRPLMVWVAALVGVGHAGAFLYALLRYQVGINGGLDPLQGTWQPPGGSLLVLLLFAVALAVHLVLLVHLAGGNDDARPSAATARHAAPGTPAVGEAEPPAAVGPVRGAS